MKELSIAIDARCLEEKERTGVARYLLNLLNAFIELEIEHRFILYLKNFDIEGLTNTHILQKRILDPEGFADNLIWEQYLLPKAAKRDKVDLIFSPMYTTPLLSRCKRAVTIHDISYQIFPEWFTSYEQLNLRTLSRLSALVSDLVLTVSEFSKSEIIRLYRIPPKKVEVVSNGVDPRFRVSGNIKRIADIKNKYGINSPYILTVGAILVRRNIPMLIKAFKLMANRVPHGLVLVGPNRTVPFQDIKGMIEKEGLEGRIIWVQYADDEDLPFLYEGADVFVYLSTYEGFGLPILEAMACGTPVVCSNAASVPEIVGNAGLFVNPLNDGDIARGLLDVLSNISESEKMVIKGIERAQTYTWRKAAEKILSVFEKICIY